MQVQVHEDAHHMCMCTRLPEEVDEGLVLCLPLGILSEASLAHAVEEFVDLGDGNRLDAVEHLRTRVGAGR